MMFQGQLEDHGPFQSLPRLWGHHAHLAVFINYVLSNSDPSSLVSKLLLEFFTIKQLHVTVSLYLMCSCSYFI